MSAEPGDVAVLMDVCYREVGVVSLQAGPLPDEITHNRRVYRYYAHTTIVGQREMRHPYREDPGAGLALRLVLP